MYLGSLRWVFQVAHGWLPLGGSPYLNVWAMYVNSQPSNCCFVVCVRQCMYQQVMLVYVCEHMRGQKNITPVINICSNTWLGN